MAQAVVLKDKVFNKIDNVDLIAPAELLAQFASLTYGAIRGVIFAKTMGTALNNIILPLNNSLLIFA